MKSRLYIILTLLSVFGSLSIKAQQFTDYEIKAAYIFNFTKFVKWPDKAFDNDNSPYVLGIYGNDPFGEIIKKIIGNRKTHGRKWVVKYYSKPEQIQQCHILFITNIQHSELKRIVGHVKRKPILTVGDEIDLFCEQGGIINFAKKNTAKRFEINNTAAFNSEISISSKLLMLSKIISNDEIKF